MQHIHNMPAFKNLKYIKTLATKNKHDKTQTISKQKYNMIETDAYHLYSDTDITQSNDLSRLTVLEIAQAEEKTADFLL